MPNGTMGTTPEPAAIGPMIERLTKLQQADLDWVKAAIDAVENDDDGDGYETPAEWLVIQMLVDYAYGRLTPESVEADLEHYTQCVKDLKDEPEPNTPEEIGAKLREDLRMKLRARVRREFLDWAKEASERDLLIMMEVLVSAQNCQTGSEFDASFITGFARMLDRDDALYCPTEYVSCVQRYIEQLTARKAVA